MLACYTWMIGTHSISSEKEDGYFVRPSHKAESRFTDVVGPNDHWHVPVKAVLATCDMFLHNISLEIGGTMPRMN